MEIYGINNRLWKTACEWPIRFFSWHWRMLVAPSWLDGSTHPEKIKPLEYVCHKKEFSGISLKATRPGKLTC